MLLHFSGESVQSIMGATYSCISNILILFSFYFSVRPIGSEQPNEEHDRIIAFPLCYQHLETWTGSFALISAHSPAPHGTALSYRWKRCCAADCRKLLRSDE